MILLSKTIPLRAITQWTNQLALLLHAHLPLAQALQLLAQAQAHPLLHDLTLVLHREVMHGMPLSYALQAFPQYFDRTYCQLIIAAEQSGKLAAILQSIAEQQTAKQQLRAQLTQALIYPSLVLMVGGLVFLLLLVWVVPQIAVVFAQFNQPLPLFTQIILGFTEIVRQFGLFFFAGCLVLGISIYLTQRYYPPCAERLAKWRWHAPGVGTLLQCGGCILFARTLAVLLMAGIPLSSALPTSLQVLENPYAIQRLRAALQLVNQGHSFSYALQQTSLFPPLAIQMWQIGEHSGKLCELLHESVNYYQQQLNELTAQLTRLLEPVLLIVLGVLIGSVVIAMYLPLFSLGLVLG